MKKLTILDEDFIAVEHAAIKEISKIAKELHESEQVVSNISLTEGADIRFAPEYIEIKARLNPVEVVNSTINECFKVFRTKRKSFSLNEATMLSEIYNELFEEDTGLYCAFEEATNIFGITENFDFSLENETLELNENGLREFQNNISKIREVAKNTLSELNEAVSANDGGKVMKELQKVSYLKKFSEILSA